MFFMGKFFSNEIKYLQAKHKNLIQQDVAINQKNVMKDYRSETGNLSD